MYGYINIYMYAELTAAPMNKNNNNKKRKLTQTRALSIFLYNTCSAVATVAANILV